MLKKELYPFKSNYLKFNGLRYHYIDEGSGEPIVMVHGNPTWSFYYRDLIRALSKKYRVIAPDHMGMGLSDKPGDDRYTYTSASRLKDLEALFEHLNLKKFTMIGHDWGGIIGTMYCSFHPQRINAMIMMNTAGFMWPVKKKLPFALFTARIPYISALFLRSSMNAFARGATFIGMKHRSMSGDVRKGYLHPYSSWKNRISVHRFIQDIPINPGDPGYDLGLKMEARLKFLKDVPLLLCWGMKDFVFCPLILDEWIRHFPDAEVHKFKNGGHYILEDHSMDIIPIIERFMANKVIPGLSTRNRSSKKTVSSRQKDYLDLTQHLLKTVAKKPDTLVVAETVRWNIRGNSHYATRTFAEVNRESNTIAHGLEKVGLKKGMHTLFLVSPGTDFFSLLTAILKIGAIPVLVDPGMGLRGMKKCIDEAAPEAFMGIPRAHAGRVLLGWARKTLKINVTVGKKMFWDGYTLEDIKKRGSDEPYIMEDKNPDDVAAITYTSGNTGTAKGVVYLHKMLSNQLKIISGIIEMGDDERDLATFPPFALFAPGMGMTSVIPDMDPTQPSRANPEKLVTAIKDFQCTNMFGSPAIIDKIGRYCESKNIRLSSLRRVISAGAPARLSSIERLLKYLDPGVQIFTPYGATESLPVTFIGSNELLKTKNRTEEGGGICVGKPVKGMQVAVIKITDDPIQEWSNEIKLPPNQIGEICAKGPVVTEVYYKRPKQTKLAKIIERNTKTVWHRMGDAGYLDNQGRLWMCGRKTHRVDTEDGTMFTLPCEAIFNKHPKVNLSALVGKKVKNGIIPVICIETENSVKLSSKVKKELTRELLSMAKEHEHTGSIETVCFYPRFPMDVRHNSKIAREKLAKWVQKVL